MTNLRKILRVDSGVFLFGIRILRSPLHVAIFWGKRGYVICGEGEGKGLETLRMERMKNALAKIAGPTKCGGAMTLDEEGVPFKAEIAEWVRKAHVTHCPRCIAQAALLPEPATEQPAEVLAS
jgi:hypothetical protein